MQMSHFRFGAILMVVAMLFAVVSTSVFAQSKPQRPETPQGEGKRNARPVPKTEEQLKKEAEEKARQEQEKNAVVEPGVEKVESNIVNVDAVV
jgi:hypothetical protein